MSTTTATTRPQPNPPPAKRRRRPAPHDDRLKAAAQTARAVAASDRTLSPQAVLAKIRAELATLDDRVLLERLAVNVLQTGAVTDGWVRESLRRLDEHPIPVGHRSWWWLTECLEAVLDPAPGVPWHVTLSSDTLTLWPGRNVRSDRWNIPVALLSTHSLVAVLELEARAERMFARASPHGLHWQACVLDRTLGEGVAEAPSLWAARRHAATHFLRTLVARLEALGVPPFALRCDLQRALVDMRTTFSADSDLHRSIRSWIHPVLVAVVHGEPLPRCERGAKTCSVCRPPSGSAARSEYARTVARLEAEVAAARVREQKQSLSAFIREMEADRGSFLSLPPPAAFPDPDPEPGSAPEKRD